MRKATISLISFVAIIFTAAVVQADEVSFEFQVKASISDYTLKDNRSEDWMGSVSQGSWIAGSVEIVDGVNYLGQTYSGTFDGRRSATKTVALSERTTTDSSDKLEWGTKNLIGEQYGRYDKNGNLQLVTGTTIYSSEQRNNTSSFEVLGKSGTYDIGDDPALALEMLHNNRNISTNSPTPNYFEIALQLFVEASTGEEATAGLLLKLGFYESPNVGNYQNDVFYLLENPFTEGTGYARLDFGDGVNYYASLYGSFERLDYENDYEYYMMAYNDMIARGVDIQEGDDIFGWITEEGKSTPNEFGLSFTIEKDIPDTPIFETVTPEPATLLVLGLGLLGMPLARRFRNK